MKITELYNYFFVLSTDFEESEYNIGVQLFKSHSGNWQLYLRYFDESFSTLLLYLKLLIRIQFPFTQGTIPDFSPRFFSTSAGRRKNGGGNVRQPSDIKQVILDSTKLRGKCHRKTGCLFQRPQILIFTETFRQLALSFPGVVANPHFEWTSFRLKGKIFATLAEDSNIATLNLTLPDQSEFCSIEKQAVYPVPNRWGQTGWTFAELNQISVELALEMLTAAFKKLTI